MAMELREEDRRLRAGHPLTGRPVFPFQPIYNTKTPDWGSSLTVPTGLCNAADGRFSRTEPKFVKTGQMQGAEDEDEGVY